MFCIELTWLGMAIWTLVENKRLFAKKNFKCSYSEDTHSQNLSSRISDLTSAVFLLLRCLLGNYILWEIDSNIAHDVPRSTWSPSGLAHKCNMLSKAEIINMWVYTKKKLKKADSLFGIDRKLKKLLKTTVLLVSSFLNV